MRGGQLSRCKEDLGGQLSDFMIGVKGEAEMASRFLLRL